MRVILVTGPSGAGRTTTVRALEDFGYEVIDNLPLSLLDRLLTGPKLDRPIVLGIDVRNRDFSVDAFLRVIDTLTRDPSIEVQLLYLDCAEDELIRRYSETRRKHPLLPDQAPIIGISQERALLVPIRNKADILIDTTGLSPHDLRVEIEAAFGIDSRKNMLLSVQSFSYRRGIPRGVDFVFDCRFLRNPHWEPSLRANDGREKGVADYVKADPDFEQFLQNVLSLMELTVPLFKNSGKSHLSIAFGCTGGQHRSVAMTEIVTDALAEKGLQVSKRHRELERREGDSAPSKGTAH
ncbi:RNase adapter RapZ [Marivivens sp. LCG002]|uniref:RNase adapter RapZ n=1 Tax=Marivivens sp. LCG002 TaxID=3051171 RepID=UPI002557ACC8|nr:RNase adapter RapZ [Marivivens sp. LCG002]WIV51053.1 RNase adapter RapZ [Marivivens sp. LCG002]